MDWLPDSVVDHLRDTLGAPDLTGSPYILGRELGCGGMGLVYEAQDRRLGRAVALKVLSPLHSDAEEARRLWREARILARLEHPGIVPVHDVGALPDGRAYYVMKMVEGRRLDDYLSGAPPFAEFCRIFLRICEPVSFAHARGIAHRDLKPQNIMLGQFGEVLVLDWGVARMLSKETGETGFVIGTAGYMAPEQQAGEATDARADIYSLGRLLGSHPGAMPAAAQSIIRRATERDPSLRYQTTDALAGDVARFLDHLPVEAHRESLPERLARLLARHRTLAVLILAYLVMRVLMIFFIRP
jgi:serine/threonine protein kinase